MGHDGLWQVPTRAGDEPETRRGFKPDWEPQGQTQDRHKTLLSSPRNVPKDLRWLWRLGRCERLLAAAASVRTLLALCFAVRQCYLSYRSWRSIRLDEQIIIASGSIQEVCGEA